jgi:uncharacterized protein (DUF433 family)
MAKESVEYREGGYRIAGTRVSLDSIVHAFLDGLSPESIVESFDTLTLEEVYGALAFYLRHREEIDVYIRQSEAEFDALYHRMRAAHPLLYQKIEQARQHTVVQP